MNPGIDNKPFEIVIKDEDMFALPYYFGKGCKVLFVDDYPKRMWKYNILYYLSLGLYDRRGWKYKVKVIK